MKIHSQEEFVGKFKDVEEMETYLSEESKKGYILIHPRQSLDSMGAPYKGAKVITPSKKFYCFSELENLLKKEKLISGNKNQIEMVEGYNLLLIKDYLLSQEVEA